MTRRGLLALVVAALAPVAGAHTISVEEVLAVLNDPKEKEKTGVVRAKQDPRLARLLVVEIGARWYAIDRGGREKLAGEWLGLWRHSLAKGVVSVLDERTGEAVVKYRPDGSVEVAERKGG